MFQLISAAAHEAVAQAAEKKAVGLYNLACGVPSEYAPPLDDLAWNWEQFSHAARGWRWKNLRRVRWDLTGCG